MCALEVPRPPSMQHLLLKTVMVSNYFFALVFHVVKRHVCSLRRTYQPLSSSALNIWERLRDRRDARRING
jgi:hypothetical protein